MKRFIVCLCLIFIGTSCELTESAKRTRQDSVPSNSEAITFFFTGNELGALKPCGCSGGQLGGLDRRSAVFNQVPRPNRLVIDIGSLVKSDGEQDLIKYNILIQAFKLLDYDLINLSEKDIEIGGNLALLDSDGSFLNLISPYSPEDSNIPRTFSRTMSLGNAPVDIAIATYDEMLQSTDNIRDFFPMESDGLSVNVLILNHYNPDVIKYIAENMPYVDCIVCSADSDEPMLLGKQNQSPLIFSVGRYGRHICGFEIKKDNDKKSKIQLSFFDQPVVEDLEQDISLIQLYSDYQQIVKEHNLLEKHPRYPLPDGLAYAGSDSCATCHQYEFIEWMGKEHADAYATLEAVGSQYDPECVVCHVVGMDYESGYVSEQETPHLEDVGCENCHGPGSKHNIDPYTKMPNSEPNSVCIKCHTPEHSNDYAGNEEEKLQKIKHWMEPNDPASVQYYEHKQ